MGSTIISSSPLVFGVATPKPLSHPVDGKLRYRFRTDEFAYAIVRHPDGHCSWAVIRDEGETWRLEFGVTPTTGWALEMARENRALKAEIEMLRRVLNSFKQPNN